MSAASRTIAVAGATGFVEMAVDVVAEGGGA